MKLNNLVPSLSLTMQFWIPKINIYFFFFFYIYSLYAVSIQCIYWTPLEQYFSNFSMNQIHLAQVRGMLVKMQIHRLHHWREGSMLGPDIAF